MKFELKYVRCTWSEDMKGTKFFVAPRISELKRIVEEGYLVGYGSIEETDSLDFPFRSKTGEAWRFAYFDPYFTLKQAREEGKTIERFWKSENEWEEWIDDEFPGDLALYRIKPSREPVTNRELSRWLAQGKGECRFTSMGDDSPYAQMAFRYCDKDGLLPVKRLVLVRKWEDTEWNEPTREYMGLEE